MKFGRRAKHLSAKMSLLGDLLQGLNRRGRRELARKGAVRAPARPRRPAFGLEPVEPRLLMSADLSYSSLAGESMQLTVGGSAGAPTINLSGSFGTVSKNLVGSGDTTINVLRSTGSDLFGDTLNIDLNSFATLNTFVSGSGGSLTIDFEGGDERLSTDHLTISGNSGALNYGLNVTSTSDIATGATINVTGNLTLQSAQTEGDVLGTGLLANANTGISLNGAHLTASQGITLTAASTLNVTTTGLGLWGVSGAIITSNSNAGIDITNGSVLTATGGNIGVTASVNGNLTASATGGGVAGLIVLAGYAAPEVTIDGSTVNATAGAVNASATTDVTLSSTAIPSASATNSKADAVVLTTTYGSGASMTVTNKAMVSAFTSNTLSASSTLVSTTTANATAGTSAGASLALSVITGDTTAHVDDATVSGSAVSVTAASDRTIITTALSSVSGAADGGGANKSEQELASHNAKANDGSSTTSVTFAGAIAISTDTGLTSAYLGDKATINAHTGVATGPAWFSPLPSAWPIARTPHIYQVR
jgi:hypothetical protein